VVYHILVVYQKEEVFLVVLKFLVVFHRLVEIFHEVEQMEEVGNQNVLVLHVSSYVVKGVIVVVEVV
jgi:hypothetical protein